MFLLFFRDTIAFIPLLLILPFWFGLWSVWLAMPLAKPNSVNRGSFLGQKRTAAFRITKRLASMIFLDLHSLPTTLAGLFL